MLFLRDAGDTEVGGFGICPGDPLVVEDIQLVKQTCTWSTVSFDDESVADFFEHQVEQGLRPDQFARVWIHTHPGRSALPSHTDEDTFERVFGNTDWAVMFILACGGQTYARMRQSDQPEETLLETEVDFSLSFPHSDMGQWQQQYDDLVCEALPGRQAEDEFWYLLEDAPAEFLDDSRDVYRLPHDDQLLHAYLEEQAYDDYLLSADIYTI